MIWYNKSETALQKLLLLAIGDCPEPTGEPWYDVSEYWLAQFCHTSVDEVQSALRRLEEIELIKIKQLPNGRLCITGGEL